MNQIGREKFIIELNRVETDWGEKIWVLNWISTLSLVKELSWIPRWMVITEMSWVKPKWKQKDKELNWIKSISRMNWVELNWVGLKTLIRNELKNWVELSPDELTKIELEGARSCPSMTWTACAVYYFNHRVDTS